MKPTKARILRLRVTVPADIYQSGIDIAIEGVEISVSFSREQPGSEKKSRKRARSGDIKAQSGENDHLPTTEDISESFLKEEPIEERRELEAAFVSQSTQLLEESQALSESSEEETAFGTGLGFTLPTFLTAILNGIADRLKVTISDVVFSLDTDVAPEDAIAGASFETGHHITLKLRADSVDVEGLTAPIAAAGMTAQQAEATTRKDKRRIRWNKIVASLESDMGFFVRLEKYPDVSSPVQSRRGKWHSRTPSNSSRMVSSSASSPTVSRSVTAEFKSDRSPLQSTTPERPRVSSPRASMSFPLPAEYDDYARFADASVDDLRLSRVSEIPSKRGSDITHSTRSINHRDEDTPIALENEFDGLFASQSSMGLQKSGGHANPAFDEPQFSHPGSGGSPSHSTRIVHLAATAPAVGEDTEPTFSSYSLPQVSGSQPIEIPTARNNEDDLDKSRLGRPEAAAQTGTSPHSGSRSSSSGRSLNEDLLESKLFTNEEADSMYMSVMSELRSEERRTEQKSVVFEEPSPSQSAQIAASAHKTIPTPSPRPSHDVPIDDQGCETPRASSPGIQNADSPYQVFQTPPQGQPRTPIKGTTSSTEPETPETRISVPLLIIDGVSLWLPWTGGKSPTAVAPEDDSKSLQRVSTDHSVYQTMPGAFSQYAERSQKMRRPPSPHPRAVSTTQRPTQDSNTREAEESTESESHMDVEIESMDAAFDISTGGVLLSVLQRLASSFTFEVADDKGASPELENADPSPMRALSLTISRLKVALLERLTSRSTVPSTHGISGVLLDHSTAVLCLDMNRISAAYGQQASDIFAKIDVEKFVFGFPQESIVSFDTETTMLASRRDLSEQQKHDISLTFRSDETRGQELELFTLPVKVLFDMTKFDDRLSYFGGLSGILDLSASITSNGTAHIPVQPKRVPSKGVRFAGQSEPAPMNVLSPVKINAKIQGVSFTLDGRACGVSVETSTLNLVVREQMAKLRVAQIVVRGPHHPSSPQAPLRLQLTETALLFRLTPEEADLESLVSLITPSRDKYEDDDDILLDTLLRQRRSGSLVKLSVTECSVLIRDADRAMQLQNLGDELSKLSNVTKYLPEDDRPGLLSMIDIKDINAELTLGDLLGQLSLHCRGSRAAHVGFPSLLAAELGKISLSRNRDELLIGPCLRLQEEDTLPMVMARQIGDELEPKVKVKLYNVVVEYRVSVLTAFMGIVGGTTPDELVTTMAASVANIRAEKVPVSLSRHLTDTSDTSRSSTTALHLDLLLRDCAIGLNPAKSNERGLILLSDARVSANMSAKEDLKLGLEIRRASVLLIDDTNCLDESAPVQLRPKSSSQTSPALTDLCRQGYASVAAISSAKVHVQAVEGADGNRLLNVDVSDKLLILEACADSLKTLASLGGSLAPPAPPNQSTAFQPHVMPITDLMASFSGEAFVKPEAEGDEGSEDADAADRLLEDLPANLHFVGSFYDPDPENLETGRQSPSSDASHSTVTIGEEDLKPEPPFSQAPEDRFEFDDRITSLVIIENYLDVASRRGAARGWNSKISKYGMLYESQTKECPLRLNVKLGTIIVNMFDGYDWIKTREAIARAVDDVQEKADRRRKQRQALSRGDEEAELEVGDFLFQSIWIAVPPNREAADLRRQINRQIDDDVTTETSTVTTATKTQATGRPSLSRRKSRALRLERGKKKISVELRSMDASVLVMPPSPEETRLNVDVRIRDLEVFDHVPTSTWNKLATCLIEPDQRQVDRPQLHLEILGVKPLPDTPNLEFVVKVKMLPLSLHVDQDTQDFAQRFGSFSDDSDEVKTSTANASPDFFIQRIEIESVPITFDYKPKRLDYAGLRSGRTGELMNLMTLDGTRFVLRHVILHGIEGGDHLYKALHSIWMNDILTNQLPGVLAGLAPIRPIVNVGVGLQELVVVPMREYRKDGRVVRSIRKGAVAFARTTTRELARLGARVAIGTQSLLEGTEGLLAPSQSTPSSQARAGIDEDWDDDFAGEPSDKEKRVVSNYANQPLNVVTGVRAAYRGLEKDLITARDAIVAIGAEVRDDGGSARGVVGAVARHGPAVVLRPAIGATRALGTVMLGAGNMLDRDGRRKVEEVGPFLLCLFSLLFLCSSC